MVKRITFVLALSLLVFTVLGATAIHRGDRMEGFGLGAAFSLGDEKTDVDAGLFYKVTGAEAYHSDQIVGFFSHGSIMLKTNLDHNRFLKDVDLYAPYMAGLGFVFQYGSALDCIVGFCGCLTSDLSFDFSNSTLPSGLYLSVGIGVRAALVFNFNHSLFMDIGASVCLDFLSVNMDFANKNTTASTTPALRPIEADLSLGLRI